MPVNQEERFGTDRWSSAADPWPGRAGWNALLDKITNFAVKFLPRTVTNRPAAGIDGRQWMDPATKRMWWDNGVEWIEMSPVGSATTATTIKPGDTATAGTGRVAARENHKHAIATADQKSPTIAYGVAGKSGRETAGWEDAGFALEGHTHDLDLAAYHELRTYTPQWKSVNAGEVQPSGGTIVGRYARLGDLVHVQVHIAFLAGVQGGRDNLYVTLPFPPVAGIPEQSIHCKLWAPSTGTWQGHVVFNPGGLIAFPLFPITAQDNRLAQWRQNPAAVTDPQQGVPKPVAGANTIEPGGRFYMSGWYMAAAL